MPFNSFSGTRLTCATGSKRSSSACQTNASAASKSGRRRSRPRQPFESGGKALQALQEDGFVVHHHVSYFGRPSAFYLRWQGGCFYSAAKREVTLIVWRRTIGLVCCKGAAGHYSRGTFQAEQTR